MAQTAKKSASPAAAGQSRGFDIDRSVSRRVRQRRVMLGLTRQQMAELTGVTYQQAHRYETGVNRIPAAWLYQIARGLGVDTNYFFEDVDSSEHADTGGGPAPSPDPASEIAAPVEFVRRLTDAWSLEERDATRLLGFEQTETLDELLATTSALRTRDVKDRVRHLLTIREALHRLFRDLDTERQWLREPKSALENRSPVALLLEGSMENLLLVSQFVQWMVGR
jgi:transcriptional regulator with XRE-family HTH domain